MAHNALYRKQWSSQKSVLSVCIFYLSLSPLSLPPSLSPSLSLSDSTWPLLVSTKRVGLMTISYHKPNGWSPYLVCVFYITRVSSSIWKWVDLEWWLSMTGMILQRRKGEKEIKAGEREEREREREKEREDGERKEMEKRKKRPLFVSSPLLSLSLYF